VHRKKSEATFPERKNQEIKNTKGGGGGKRERFGIKEEKTAKAVGSIKRY